MQRSKEATLRYSVVGGTERCGRFTYGALQAVQTVQALRALLELQSALDLAGTNSISSTDRQQTELETVCLKFGAESKKEPSKLNQGHSISNISQKNLGNGQDLSGGNFDPIAPMVFQWPIGSRIYAAFPRNARTLPPRWVCSRKSAQSCIIFVRGSR
jgi:hypothetical protein